MKECYQFKDMNMLQHGEMVHDYFCDLHELLIGNKPRHAWDIPDNVLSKLKKISTSALLRAQVKDYHIYHDCGKHISRIIDEDGKQHFPDHVISSYNRWLKCGGDGITAYLILNDMYFHTTKTECLTKITYYETLLLTAWAEIHANAEMFGGIDSTSFKIKKKKLIKATNKLVS